MNRPKYQQQCVKNIVKTYGKRLTSVIDVIFWIFYSIFSHFLKLKASLIFLSGRTCTTGG